MLSHDQEAANSFLPDPPTKTFKRYIVVGLIFTGILLFLTYLVAISGNEKEFPYIADETWGLPAAAVLATIAVAMVVLDIPLRRQQSAALTPVSELDSPSKPQPVVQQDENHAAEQLKLSKGILNATGILAVICAATSLLILIGPDGTPADGRLIEVIVTAGAHLIVAAVCSSGLAFKAETFLKRSIFEDFKSRYNEAAWFAEWGLGPRQLKEPTPKSWWQTSIAHIVIALIPLCAFTLTAALAGSSSLRDVLIFYFFPLTFPTILFILSVWFCTEISLDEGIGQRMKAQKSSGKINLSFAFFGLMLFLTQALFSLLILIEIDLLNSGLTLTYLLTLLITYSCFTVFVERKFIREFHFDPDKNGARTAKLTTMYIKPRLRNKLITRLKRSQEYIAKHNPGEISS